MTWLYVKDHFKEYQSHYFETFDFISDQDIKSIINFKLFLHVIIFLRNDIIWNKCKFILILDAFTETNETITLWEIKNIAQLVCWIKADLKLFLQAFSNL